MIDGVATLISEAETYDQYGNRVGTLTERDVFCRVSGVTRSEYYQAATVDLQPEITITLSDYADYQGEKVVRMDGVLYSVIRTYRDAGSHHSGRGMDANAIELVLERKIGVVDPPESE